MSMTLLGIPIDPLTHRLPDYEILLPIVCPMIDIKQEEARSAGREGCAEAGRKPKDNEEAGV